jgi:hypothetical protein
MKNKKTVDISDEQANQDAQISSEKVNETTQIKVPQFISAEDIQNKLIVDELLRSRDRIHRLEHILDTSMERIMQLAKVFADKQDNIKY